MVTANRLPTLFGLLFLLLACMIVACQPSGEKTVVVAEEGSAGPKVHHAPDTADIPDDEFGDLVRYGRELILNTAYYIGPEGKAGRYLGNKMNCTNCHLDGGTRPYGLNYLSSHGRYPQFRPRENRILSLSERVNNCIERPHNGRPLPMDSREMNAIVSYIKWLGSGVPVGQRVEGDKGLAIALPDYRLDIRHGEEVFVNQCARCHGKEGQGKMRADNVCYEYPPLWGKKAYQSGSSMFRIIRAARFIKANMPHDQASWRKPKLSDRDALDVAAYINSEQHARPPKRGDDYPNGTHKPIDYPFGPYDDPFSEAQHKYGPYKPIIEYRQGKELYVNY